MAAQFRVMEKIAIELLGLGILFMPIHNNDIQIAKPCIIALAVLKGYGLANDTV